MSWTRKLRRASRQDLVAHDPYRLSGGKIGIVEAGTWPRTRRGDHHAWQSGRGSDERTDQERALFGLPVPLDGRVLRVGEPSRLRAVDARPVSGGDRARDEVLRFRPRAKRAGRAARDRRTR